MPEEKPVPASEPVDPEHDFAEDDPEEGSEEDDELEESGEESLQTDDTIPKNSEAAEKKLNVDPDPHSQLAQDRIAQGLTRTGKNKIEESAKGVGGDHTIGPGGSAGTGSGHVDPQGFVHETVVDPHASVHLGSFKPQTPPAEQPK